jgi:hypothetical protein
MQSSVGENCAMPLWSYWLTTVRGDSAIRKLIGTRGCQLAPRLPTIAPEKHYLSARRNA